MRRSGSSRLKFLSRASVSAPCSRNSLSFIMSTCLSSSENSTPTSTDSQTPSASAAPAPTTTPETPAAAAPVKRQNAVWTSADNATLVDYLKDARTRGGQADNGWKSWVWTEAGVLLAGGKGGPKTWKGCRDHWRTVSSIFIGLSTYVLYHCEACYGLQYGPLVAC